MPNIEMTEEDYKEFLEYQNHKQEFLKYKNKSASMTRLCIDSDSPIYHEAMSEISSGFSPATFDILKNKIVLLSYPKGSKIALSTASTRYLGYLVDGVVKTTIDGDFLNFTTPKNWLGTVILSEGLIQKDDKDSCEIVKNSNTSLEMKAQTDVILAMLELDSSVILQLKTDLVFKNTLLSDLISIIKANDALQYILMHGHKVSLMAAYLAWKMENENLKIWSPVPTELAEYLDFSLSDVRRAIETLIQRKILIPGKNFERNAKKRFYYLSEDAKGELLKEAKLTQHQIKDLSRIFYK